jgi:hypothetical protein
VFCGSDRVFDRVFGGSIKVYLGGTSWGVFFCGSGTGVKQGEMRGVSTRGVIQEGDTRKDGVSQMKGLV